MSVLTIRLPDSKHARLKEVARALDKLDSFFGAKAA